MESVVPGRAANQRDETLCRGERKWGRCYVYIRQGHLGSGVSDIVSRYLEYLCINLVVVYEK